MTGFHPGVGTVVELNSGGPLMTIVKIEDVMCHCTWFMPDATLRAHSFPASALRRRQQEAAAASAAASPREV